MPTPSDSPRSGILAGGNWIIDHVKIVDRYPEQDTLASILRLDHGTGGSPYNILIDLAKLGAKFPLEGIGLVGDDADGRTILGDCETFGIDAAQMHTTTGAGTSYTDVMTVESTGRRTFFHYRGANALLDEQHFNFQTSQAKIFHLGYILLLDALDVVAADGSTGGSRLLAKARDLGFKTSLDVVSVDPELFAKLVHPALPYLDYLVVNEFEAGCSAGVEVTVDGKVCFKRLSEAAAKLIDAGVHEWVVIHCPEGALARNAAGEETIHGSVNIPPGEIAGAAGAGDAFAAGVLFGLHDDHPIRECLRIGACAAASNLTHSTCTGGILPLEECLRRGDERGFRSPE
jgi:sugar/nucleoside kinase (ribokinase family)